MAAVMRGSFRRLLNRFRDGDPVATEELLRRYTPVLREAVRERLPQRLRGEFESLDFVQEVWTAVCGARWVPSELKTSEQLEAYLSTVAVNRVVDALRHRGTLKCGSGAETVPLKWSPPGAEPTPSQVVMADEKWENLAATLTGPHLRVLERIRQGFTQEEIAAMTGVSLRVISRIVQHVRRECEAAQ